MRDHAVSVACWLVLTAAPIAVPFLPLTELEGEQSLAVLFPPWIDEEMRTSALVDADVSLTGRPSGLVLTGSVSSSWNDARTLRERGALLVLSTTTTGLCLTPNTDNQE